MRLTSKKVRLFRDIIIEVTGEQWFTIGGDGPHGTRYANTQDQTVYIGGEGAASVLSYYLGVAIAYGEEAEAVARENAEAAEVLVYLSTSGQIDGTARDLGESHARRYKARQVRAANAAVVIEDGQSVEIVAYGDDVHLYEPGDDSAEVVYMVAVGSNLDVTRAVVTGERWREKVLPVINASIEEIEVHDHR